MSFNSDVLYVKSLINLRPKERCSGECFVNYLKIMLLISFQPSVRLRSSVEDFEKGIEPYTKVTTVQLLNLPGCILLQGYHQSSTVKRK